MAASTVVCKGGGTVCDMMFNAFHYKAAKCVLEHILPFWSMFDKAGGTQTGMFV